MKIVAEENLLLNNQNVGLIQQLYKSDIRSMVNFMQTNQNIQEKDMNIIQESIWEDLYQRICTQDTVKNIEKYIHSISLLYNINKKNIIKDFFNYMIRKRCDVISCDFLKSVENIMHFENSNESYYVNYALTRLLLHIPKE